MENADSAYYKLWNFNKPLCVYYTPQIIIFGTTQAIFGTELSKLGLTQ